MLHRLNLFAFAVTILFMVFLCESLNGQNTREATTSFKRFQFGCSFSPEMGYRFLHNKEGSFLGFDIIRVRNEQEAVRFSYAVGFNFCYNLKKYVGLETGLQYANRGFQTELTKVTAASPDPDMPKSFRLVSEFHFIDVPLKVNFTFGHKKWKVIAGAGMLVNVFLKWQEKFVKYYDHHTTIQTNNQYSMKPVNLSALVSCGLVYDISSKFSFRAEPTFKCALLTSSRYPIDTRLFSAGVNLSFYYGL